MTSDAQVLGWEKLLASVANQRHPGAEIPVAALSLALTSACTLIKEKDARIKKLEGRPWRRLLGRLGFYVDVAQLKIFGGKNLADMGREGSRKVLPEGAPSGSLSEKEVFTKVPAKLYSEL
jgi:hypothetical protein